MCAYLQAMSVALGVDVRVCAGRHAAHCCQLWDANTEPTKMKAKGSKSKGKKRIHIFSTVHV